MYLSRKSERFCFRFKKMTNVLSPDCRFGDGGSVLRVCEGEWNGGGLNGSTVVYTLDVSSDFDVRRDGFRNLEYYVSVACVDGGSAVWYNAYVLSVPHDMRILDGESRGWTELLTTEYSSRVRPRLCYERGVNDLCGASGLVTVNSPVRTSLRVASAVFSFIRVSQPPRWVVCLVLQAVSVGCVKYMLASVVRATDKEKM